MITFSALGSTGLQNLFLTHSNVPEAPRPDSNPQTRKLYKACQQFEGILISNLWSEMDQGISMTDSDSGSDPGASTMQGLGIQSAAMGIAEAGGVGIARMLYQALAPRLSASQPEGGKGPSSG